MGPGGITKSNCWLHTGPLLINHYQQPNLHSGHSWRAQSCWWLQWLEELERTSNSWRPNLHFSLASIKQTSKYQPLHLWHGRGSSCYCMKSFSQRRTRGDDLKLCQGHSGWILGKKISLERVMMQRHSCPGRWWGHRLEVFQNHGDVAMRDVVSGHGGGGMVVGLGDLWGLFQP